MDLFHFNLQLPITDPTWIFLLVLLIILFAPILLNKLRIPHIIGMILAGLVIGEHGLNILARDSSFELFGKVGVYYIMFLAGLEMNMSDFKKNRGKAVMLGLLAFIIPIGIGMVTNMILLEYSLLTSILLASMYASHTLVAYPIVIRYGISRHRSVSIAVGGTAVTDTLTLLVLAVISGLFKGEGGGLFWLWLVVKVVVLGVLIMQLFPRIGRWFFRRYDDNVMQFIFVLAMVFLGAGLMEFIGMEGILGAFLVGLVLNRLIPHVSPLMSHLEFVGNALFIPYFLIGVGMLIDIHVIFGGGDALKVAGVMIVVALVGKWIASWLTQKIYRMSPLERELMFGLSNAQAAATLAAVLVGYGLIQPNGERLLNEDVLNGTVLLILVTCVVSSFITERAARRVAMDEAHLEESDSSRVPEKILIPVANPATIEYLMCLSLLIRDPKQKDNLVALNVINDHTESDRLEQQGKRYLERAAKIAASAGLQLQCISRYDLNIAAGIIHTAREYDATDVVIGLHYKLRKADRKSAERPAPRSNGGAFPDAAQHPAPHHHSRAAQGGIRSGLREVGGALLPYGGHAELPRAFLCQRADHSPAASLGAQEVQRHDGRVLAFGRLGRPAAADGAGQLRPPAGGYQCAPRLHLLRQLIRAPAGAVGQILYQ